MGLWHAEGRCTVVLNLPNLNANSPRLSSVFNGELCMC